MTKKTIKTLTLLGLIVSVAVLCIPLGAMYSCSQSNGFLTKSLQCLNVSSLKHCYFPEDKAIHEANPLMTTDTFNFILNQT